MTKANKKFTRFGYWKLKMRVRVRNIRMVLAEFIELLFDAVHSRVYPRGYIIIPRKFNPKTQEYDRFYSYKEYKKIVERDPMPKSKRKFYKTIIEVEVLSEHPYEVKDLDIVYSDITFGTCSGRVEVIESAIIDSVEAANLLITQGTDPEFFRLTATGEDEHFDA